MTIFYSIFAYFTFTSLLAFLNWQSVLKDAVVTPLYLLVPMGIGLFLLSPPKLKTQLKSTWKLGQIALTGTFLAMIGVTCAYYVLEVNGHLIGTYVYIYPVIKLVSLLGYFRWRTDFSAPARTSIRNSGLAIYALVGLFMYYFYFVYFSDFPLRDTFQDTYFLKGATELAKFHILNLFTADSYIPIIQVHLSFLGAFYHADIFNIQWFLPLVMFPFHLACCFYFVKSFTTNVFIRNTTVVLLAILAKGVFAFNNDNMALFCCFLVASLFTDTFTSATSMRGALLRSTSIILPFAALKFFQATFSQGLAVMVGGLAALWTASFQKRNLAPTLIIVFLAAASYFLHRSTLLYLPLAIFCALAFFALNVWLTGPTPKTKFNFGRYFFYFLAVFAPTVLLIWLLSALEVIKIDGRPFYNFIYLVVGLILRKKINPANENDTAGDFTNTLIEWFRVATPYTHVVLLFALGAYYFRFRKDVGKVSRGDQNFITLCVLVAGLSLMTTFSNIPFIYRGAFFGVAYICAGATALLMLLYDDLGPRRLVRWLVGFSFFFIFVWGFKAYNLRVFPSQVKNEYLRDLYPLNALLIAAFVIFFLWAWRKPALVSKKVLVAFFVFMILFDRLNVVTKLYFYSYGSEFPAPRVISHYTHLEIKAAHRLSDLPAKAVIFSDPYTTSLFRAVTGNNGFYSFLNIDSVLSEYEPTLLNFVHGIQTGTSQNPRQELQEFLTAFPGAGPEAAYVYQKTLGLPYSMDSMGSDLLFVFSEKTFAWAEQTDTYYPKNSPLSADLLNNIKKYFDVVENFEDRILIAKLK